MANFCTNCGSKVDDDDSFCTNCGKKVYSSSKRPNNYSSQKIPNHKEKYVKPPCPLCGGTGQIKEVSNTLLGQMVNVRPCRECGGTGKNTTKPHKKPKGFFGKIKSNDRISKYNEMKKARKELKEICGGITVNDSFENELKRNGLSTNDGVIIRANVNAEISSGKIKSSDVRNRVDELLLEYKSNLEEKIEEFKFIDEFFESDEIKSKISKGKISQSQVISIKSNLKNKVRFGETKLSEDEIKKELNTELEKEIINTNRITYIEDMIEESCPNIKLTNFEQEYINIAEMSGTIDEMKNKLNSIAKNIISRYEKIDEYDFAGILLEDRGFTNGGPLSPRRIEKVKDDKSIVFLKVFNNSILIVKTDMGNFEYIGQRPKKYNIKGEMTLYFSDINAINYSNEKIILNLNSEKFTLQDYFKGLVKTDEYETFIDDFYNLLNNAWTKFKNNESDGSANKSGVSTADELMKYAELYEKGILSEDEFNAIKKKLLQL